MESIDIPQLYSWLALLVLFLAALIAGGAAFHAAAAIARRLDHFDNLRRNTAGRAHQAQLHARRLQD